MSMNNLIQFPNGSVYSFSAQGICTLEYKPISDMTNETCDEVFPTESPEWQISENSDIPLEVQPLQPSSVDLIKAILDMQDRINYYLSDITLLGLPSKK